MTTLIDEEDPSKGHIQIRVGFHCGSIVASLIARKYTLLGGECRERATGSPQGCAASAAVRVLRHARGRMHAMGPDTMNVASRMESHSEPNKVNLSMAAQRLLEAQARILASPSPHPAATVASGCPGSALRQAPSARVMPRGEIEIKGKGRMTCFFMDGSGAAKAAICALPLVEKPRRDGGRISLDGRSSVDGRSIISAAARIRANVSAVRLNNAGNSQSSGHWSLDDLPPAGQSAASAQL